MKFLLTEAVLSVNFSTDWFFILEDNGWKFLL